MDRQREAFKEFWRARNERLGRDENRGTSLNPDGSFFCDDAQAAWEAWRAAQESAWTQIDFNRDDLGAPKDGDLVNFVHNGVQQGELFEFRTHINEEPYAHWYHEDIDELVPLEEGQFWCYAPQFRG